MVETGHRKRCKRIEVPGHVHELKFSCYKQRPFLNSRLSRDSLAESILKAKTKHKFDIWAYVIMLEHIHLIIFPKESDYSISKILYSIKRPVAKEVIKHMRENSSRNLKLLSTGQKNAPCRFWLPGGGYDRNITEVDTLLKVVNYIHRNPVRRGLVDNPGDWYWSSYNEWLKLGAGPIPIDRESFPTT